jgi:hypothetical protein
MVQGNQSDSDGNYNATSTFGGVAKQYADRIGDTAEKGAKAIVQKVQETGNAASDKAQKFGASVENQADSALSSVGDTVSSFAGTIRDNSPAKELGVIQFTPFGSEWVLVFLLVLPYRVSELSYA